jgi:biotin synthase-like enzyme
MFMAGTNGTLVGNYLATRGRPAEEDITLIKGLGLRVKP